MKPMAEDPLEQAISRALRDLPARRAPQILESLVVGELQRRAALPWWRHGFARWPVGVRGAFIATSSALGLSAVLAYDWVFAELAALYSRALPASALYAVLVAGAALYTVLFGLGATAYRTLYLNHSLAGD